MMSAGCGVFILIVASCTAAYRFNTNVHYKTSRSMNCDTPDNKPGRCVPVHNCHHLVRMSSNEEYLEKSHCGFIGSVPHVCCPKENEITIENLIQDDVSNHTNFWLLPQECGYGSKANIKGGERTTGLGQYPWMALLQYTQKRTGHKTYKCGGVLINRRYVLTAAHCITQDFTAVILGEHDIFDDPDCVMNEEENKMECAPSPIIMGIEKVVMHPEFIVPDPHSDMRSKYDIALIRLDKDIPSDRFNTYRPICIPRGDILAKDYVNYAARVAGWGATESGSETGSNVLMHVKLTVTDTRECARKYREIDNIDKSQICAIGEEGKGTCQGDSGGPLMIADKARRGETVKFFVIGIVSFGPKFCGTKGWPAVYTRVSAFTKWILDHLEK